MDIPATLCLTGVMLCWGTTPVLLRALRVYVPDGFTANLIRYPLGTLPYLPLVILAARSGKLGWFWLAALLPTAPNLIGQTLWAWTPYFLDASMFSFLFRLGLVWGIVSAFLVFPDERPLLRNPHFWTGAAVAFTGFLIMVLDGVSFAGNVSVVGILLVLGCGVSYGLYGVCVRYIMRDLNPLVVFGTVGLYTSAGCILLAPLGEPASIQNLGRWPWLLLAVSALSGISAAHGMYYMAVQRIGVAVSVLTLNVTPFVTAVTALYFLDEHLSPQQWIGGCVLTAGALLALRSQTEVKSKLPPADTEF
jgi:drug/metabolite transporter (DMT)-like permease